MIAAIVPFLLSAGKILFAFVLKPSNLIIAGVLAFLAYQTGHWRGDSYRNRVWVARIEAEREKQEQIVTRTDNKALLELRRRNSELEDRNALINVLLAEAEKDPDAGRVALGADSVRRIYAIGPRKSE